MINLFQLSTSRFLSQHEPLSVSPINAVNSIREGGHENFQSHLKVPNTFRACGSSIFSEIVLSGRASRPPGAPAALETVFGCMIIANAANENDLDVASTFRAITEPYVNTLLQRFWLMEEMYATPPLSSEDRECEIILIYRFWRQIGPL
ncbi:hypothetical protein EVAR_10715_1 [Eumeta japonica]|uniref:Uncharacterized protein n=1 Tax=Eumeta variegata TaxID=151549 RepID=A0A4C1U757_EUMVA|nr:hypothetical protein EVAR_10715_1 [Eumeta japonica]